MTENPAVRRRNTHSRVKVKTGCATCKIRKVKCDENKPSCQRCVDTGRTCDGYESPFRFFASNTQPIKSGAGLQPAHRTLTRIDPQEIDLLNRYFSTKTMFDVKLACDEEARQLLQASLTDPTIRHAISSLRALREDFETSAGIAAPAVPQTLSYDYGLQQYCMALGGLASNLSSPGSGGLKSALLCCQIFISIEQMRGNFSTVAQHITQGLKIMHEYRARPTLVAANELVPAHPDQLPYVDVYLIKLFAAPCKFAPPEAQDDSSGTTTPVGSGSPHSYPVQSCHFRAIAPDRRAQLTRIGTSTLEFLSRVSRIKSTKDALELLSDKVSLLDSLESWRVGLELVHTEIRPTDTELIPVAFMRFFHQTLKIILLGALASSSDLDAELRVEHDQLQDIASDVEERVKAYRRGGKS